MIEASAKGSMILMLGQMVSTLISALGAIVVARILGSTDYGLLSIAIIPVNLAMILVNNGVTNGVINFVARDRFENQGRNVWSIVLSGFIINVSAGLVTAFVLLVSSGYLAKNIFSQPEIALLIRILSLTTLFQALFQTSTAVLVGFEHMKKHSILGVFYSLLRSLIAPILVFLGYGVLGAAYGKTIPLVSAGLLSILLVYQTLNRVEYTGFSREFFKPILDYSAPILLSAILSGLFSQGLQFILSINVAASAVGHYSAAVNFNSIIALVLTPISTAMFPLLSKIDKSEKIFQSIYNNIIKYEAMVAYPMAFGIIALASRVIGVLYGSDYEPAILYLKLLMLNFLFIGVGGTVNNILLNSQRRTDVGLRTTLLSLIVGIPCGLILIPRYGVIGFIAATILVPKLGLFYNIFWIRRSFDISLDVMSTGKILLSTLVGYFACRFALSVVDFNVWFEIFFAVAVFAPLYFVSLIVIGGLTSRNLMDIKRLTCKNRFGKMLLVPVLDWVSKYARKEDQKH